jgi:predicted transcriptional regulator
MSSTTVSIRIDLVIKKRLEKLARITGWSRSSFAAEAISEYVDLNEWRVAGIQKAVASLDRGGAGALGSSKWLLYPGTRQWDECMK